jgi:branched-chain amino acid transport system permease protein
MSFTTVWQAFISGILNGAVYGLVSIGLSMIFGVVKIVNFAHGEFLMVGMYVSYALWALLGIDPLLTVPLVMIVLFFFGAGIQRFFIRRVLNAPDLAQIFLTVGLSVLMMNLALFLFRADFRSVKVPYADWTFTLAGAIISVPVSSPAKAIVSSCSWRSSAQHRCGKAIEPWLRPSSHARKYQPGANATSCGISAGWGSRNTISFYSPSQGAYLYFDCFRDCHLGTLGNLKEPF